MKHYRLHLTTRCGCTRVIDNGIERPPPEYTLPLRPARDERRDMVLALSLANFDADGVADLKRPPSPMATRAFRQVSYSGTPDEGTAFYEEV